MIRFGLVTTMLLSLALAACGDAVGPRFPDPGDDDDQDRGNDDQTALLDFDGPRLSFLV